MIGRLRDWLGRLLGRGGADPGDADAPGDTATESEEAAATDYECTVCGTAVDGPEAACPLCGAGVAAADRQDAGPAEVREPDATDDAATQLRELRDEHETDPD